MTTIASSTTLSNDLMAAVNPKAAAAKAADGTVEGDTNKFLTLLVTQLKNQDPMNPLDNAQLTSQLAQLSTVTGVNKLNTTLESLKASYQSSESMQAANMLGRGVLTTGNGITVEKSAAVMGVELGTAADSVKVDIFDSTGKLVHSIDLGALPAGTTPMGWDGKVDNLDGTGVAGVVKDGAYTMKVTAMAGGTELKDALSLTYGQVASVSTSATDGVKLNVLGKGAVTMADIKQIL